MSDEVVSEVEEVNESDENPDVESDKPRKMSESSSSDSEESAEIDPEEPPKKKRVKKNEEATAEAQQNNDEEDANPEAESEKAMEKQLKLLFAKASTKSKDYTEDEEKERKREVEKQVQNFLMKMDKAFDDDREAMYSGKRPWERLKFMKEIKKTLQNKEMSMVLMTERFESKISSAQEGKSDINTVHSHFLDYCAYFIQPIVIENEKIPPSPGIILDMMNILNSMPWSYSSFAGTHIIETLQELPMKRGTELYNKRKELLNKWSRIISLAREEPDGLTGADEAMEDNGRGKKSRHRDEHEDPADERWHEQELELLRWDAKKRSEYNVKDLQLEQALRSRRRAAGMRPAPEFRENTRFVVPPKMNTHSKKKVRSVETGGGVARINRLLK